MKKILPLTLQSEYGWSLLDELNNYFYQRSTNFNTKMNALRLRNSKYRFSGRERPHTVLAQKVV